VIKTARQEKVGRLIIGGLTIGEPSNHNISSEEWTRNSTNQKEKLQILAADGTVPEVCGEWFSWKLCNHKQALLRFWARTQAICVVWKPQDEKLA
jgi:hypothetical protein